MFETEDTAARKFCEARDAQMALTKAALADNCLATVTNIASHKAAKSVAAKPKPLPDPPGRPPGQQQRQVRKLDIHAISKHDARYGDLLLEMLKPAARRTAV